MSDKALIYLHSPQDQQLSCGLYLHADGWQVKELLARALPYMRHADTHYDFAKLVAVTGARLGIAALGRTFCVYPPPKGGCSYEEQMAYVRTPRNWPGDAGVFIVDVTTWQCEYVGGYGFSNFRKVGAGACALDTTNLGVLLEGGAYRPSLDDLIERQDDDPRKAIARPDSDA